jgi:hypothetical protein
MSYGFMVYALDLDKLKAACGSSDDKLRRMICGRFKRDLQSHDEGKDEGELTVREALRQIIMGGAPDSRSGSTYAYAFKLLCEHFGKFLPNAPLLPIRLSFIDDVDGALREMGAFDAVSLSKLAYRGLPINLPSPDDFPMTGYMTPEEIRPALAQLSAAKYAGEDRDIAEAIDCIQSWLKAASDKQQALVSFVH